MVTVSNTHLAFCGMLWWIILRLLFFRLIQHGDRGMCHVSASPNGFLPSNDVDTWDILQNFPANLMWSFIHCRFQCPEIVWPAVWLYGIQKCPTIIPSTTKNLLLTINHSLAQLFLLSFIVIVRAELLWNLRVALVLVFQMRFLLKITNVLHKCCLYSGQPVFVQGVDK